VTELDLKQANNFIKECKKMGVYARYDWSTKCVNVDIKNEEKREYVTMLVKEFDGNTAVDVNDISK
jgi:hypothetical protein